MTMKTGIIIILAIAALFLFVQAYIAQNTSDTEQQEYVLIENDGIFEIRYYPSAIMAACLLKAITKVHPVRVSAYWPGTSSGPTVKI